MKKIETIIDAYPRTGIPRKTFRYTNIIPIIKLVKELRKPRYVAILKGTMEKDVTA
jgi:hypothetical protein